ncbi:CatA-like O-acetyltransferase, partial [uncultured Clostridium sp.]|uniref:CatA-like O-acetyltransferase n=1 Tax=uncultured Clostridium sp. TaxID=59620 RepID=UPI00280B4DD8
MDMDNYYRKDVFKHFSEDCKCSTSITSKINVTKLVEYSKDTKTKFYINFFRVSTKSTLFNFCYKIFLG